MHFIPIDQQDSTHLSSTSVFEKGPSSCTAESSAEECHKQGDVNLTLFSLLRPHAPNRICETESKPSASFENPFNDPRLEPRPLADDGEADEESEHNPCSLTALIESGLDFSVLIPDDERCNDKTSENTNSKKRELPQTTTSSPSVSKRARLSLFANLSSSSSATQFRPHQDVLWLEHLERLRDFKQQHGHCCVPIAYEKDQMLARWVKRQRYQYKRKNDGKSTAINESRMSLLDQLGFIWDAHSAQWEESLNELAAYAKRKGHCHIRSYDPEDSKLSTWVKCQRRQYKLLQLGEPSNMTEERIEKLNSLGFVWSIRDYKSS